MVAVTGYGMAVVQLPGQVYYTRGVAKAIEHVMDEDVVRELSTWLNTMHSDHDNHLLEKDEWPDVIRDLEPRGWVRVWTTQDRRAVELNWGGGFADYGALIIDGELSAHAAEQKFRGYGSGAVYAIQIRPNVVAFSRIR